MNVLKKIRTIFNNVDVMGIYFGDNNNEYDIEIKELINSRVLESKDTEKIEKELNRIFENYFEEYNSEKVKKLAMEIILYLQENK